MKTNIDLRTTLIRSTLALSVAGMAWLPSVASAQAKGGEKLMQLSARTPAADTTTKETASVLAMSCPKCTDRWVTVVQPLTKGSQRETKVIAQHQCPTCQTKLVIEGVGRQAKEKVTHLCKMSANQGSDCCALKKVSPPTPDMEGHTAHSH
jgi:hypothetical protein